MYRHRRRAAGTAAITGLYRQNQFSEARKSVHQRHRSPAISGRKSDRPDFRGYQHARFERRRVRTVARQPPDDYLHDAYSEYAVEGFKLDAIDYLLKPFSFADFNRSVTKAQSLYELLAYRKTQGDVPAPEATPRDREYISIKADYKTTLVRISDIVYLESEGEYVRLHLDDRSTITTLFRLKNMEAALPSEMFMRVHRSYIVNLQRIRSYVKGRVFISDSEYVPIGENYREAFQRYIEAHYQNL